MEPTGSSGQGHTPPNSKSLAGDFEAWRHLLALKYVEPKFVQYVSRFFTVKSSLDDGLEALALFHGKTKDFVVTNPGSAGAASPDGSPYPGTFKPVG